MAYETILFETSDDNVATITLNRPKAMNSFNGKMVIEFGEVWRAISDDDKIHAVVLRASEGRAFCTGVDVKEGLGGFQSTNIWNEQDPGDLLSPKRNKVWKPVIAAVHGLAGGGAFYWLNESDIIICSEDAQFFDPHVTYGMTAALEPIGMCYKIPLGDVLRMALLGNDERMSAQTALNISLVSEVVSREKLWDRAHEIAATIAAKPPAAIQGTVRAIWESRDMHRNAALDMALKYTQVGNPVGTAQVDRWKIMNAPKTFNLR